MHECVCSCYNVYKRAGRGGATSRGSLSCSDYVTQHISIIVGKITLALLTPGGYWFFFFFFNSFIIIFFLALVVNCHYYTFWTGPIIFNKFFIHYVFMHLHDKSLINSIYFSQNYKFFFFF